MSTTKLDSGAIRQRLLTRRRELLTHYHTLLDLAEEEQDPEIELVDSSNEQWDLRVLSLMSEADAHALSNVVAALERLDAGVYGDCASCGARIKPARLEVLPEAALCIECAQFAEQREPRSVTAAG